MPGFIAKKLCPQLELVHGSFSKYKRESAVRNFFFIHSLFGFAVFISPSNSGGSKSRRGQTGVPDNFESGLFMKSFIGNDLKLQLS